MKKVQLNDDCDEYYDDEAWGDVRKAKQQTLLELLDKTQNLEKEKEKLTT